MRLSAIVVIHRAPNVAVMDLKPRYTARKRKKNRNEVDAPARQPTVTAISEIPQPMLGATAVRHDQYLIHLVFIRDNLTAKQQNSIMQSVWPNVLTLKCVIG